MPRRVTEEITTPKLFDAIEEICAIIKSGDLDQVPEKIISYDASYRKIDPNHVFTKDFADNYLPSRVYSSKGPAAYDEAMNTILFCYADIITYGLNRLAALSTGMETGHGYHDDVRDRVDTLQDSFSAAAKHCLDRARFSEKYETLFKTIAVNFTRNLEESGSLDNLRNWRNLSIADRQILLADIVNGDFIKAVRNADEEFQSIPALSLSFADFFDGTLGTYSEGKITLAHSLLQQKDPTAALETAVHEGGHHVDHFIRCYNAPSYTMDAKLLNKCFELMGLAKIEVYHDILYAKMPHEKFNFEAQAAAPIIRRMHRERQESELDKTVAARADSIMKNLGLSVRDFIKG